ncbi:MAG: GTP-binding protein, partial [Burkholderiales bacterium]
TAGLTGGTLRAAHSRNVQSISTVLPRPASWAGLAAWMALVTEHFGTRLLRAKGLIEIAEISRPVAVHGMAGYFHRPEALARWPSNDHRSRLVCIVQGVELAELEQSFRAFALAPGTERPRSIAELTAMEVH